MKLHRLAIGIMAVSTLLAAEPICHHLVFPAVHKHHSKATISKWTAYNAQYHINPKAKEILAELDIVCTEVRTQDATTDQTGFLLPTDAPQSQWVDQEVFIPVDNLTPAESNFYLMVGNTEPNLVSSQVPEPRSLILFGTGLLALALITIHRKKQATNGI